MKSPMIETATYLEEKTGYSELQVLCSGAGWYIGTIYTDPKAVFREPGSRDSDYFPTEVAAQAELDRWTCDGASGNRLTP